MKATQPILKVARLAVITLITLLLTNASFGQMRQVYLDGNANNQITKLSFYSPSEGYIAFTNWVGYTTDSGRTYTPKSITANNVNYNGYSVNLTFGFSISGVKAFNKNTIIVYGNYGFVSSILYSTDGGNTFKLVYNYSYNALELSSGISDMVFPTNDNIGYAVDADYILKTTDKGLTWQIIYTSPGSFFDHIEAIDDNNAYAMSTSNAANPSNKALKTTNGGSNWQSISFPNFSTSESLGYVFFLNASTGWASLFDNTNAAIQNFYKTTDGGLTWVQQNNTVAEPFSCGKMKFVNDSTGYALEGLFNIYKTSNSGATWEPLPRDNAFTYLGYTYNDLQFASSPQLWAGGGHGFLALSTNAGGTPLPKAYFLIDTTGYASTKNVSLDNYSRKIYSYKWFVNNVQISTAYNTSYTHNINNSYDTIKLIVSNGVHSDTAISYRYFYPPVIVSSVKPDTAAAGAVITITGSNFTGATAVTFGNTEAANFSVLSSTLITATVGAGATGAVQVTTPTGQGSLPGFVFVLPPTISSFAPTKATAGTTVTIYGSNFIGTTAVYFGGVAATSFTIISSTQITATAPSGPSGIVSVKTPGGSANLAGFIALPVLSSFTPSHGTEGTIITLVGTSLNGITSATIGGVKVQSFTINSSDTISAVVSTGGTGNVTIASPDGSASLPGFTWFAAPVLNSFSPTFGPVGTSVTLSGNRFDATPQNNIVYFGGVQAKVLSGNGTSLTVTVPSGATFDAITVTSHNLIGYSHKPFIVTFPNGGSITEQSFNKSLIIKQNTAGFAFKVKLADIDGDGKLDIIATKSSAYPGVLIYRNTSTDKTVSFDTAITLTKIGFEDVAVGDLDGDGKPDLAVTNSTFDFTSSNSVSTFLNTSTPGKISFTAGTVLPTGYTSEGICLGDVDGDGKADIAICLYPDGYTTVFRNTSNPGNIAFAAGVNFNVSGTRNITMADVDGDGRPELLIGNGGISILRNNSTIGSVSFDTIIQYTNGYHYYITTGDMDNDGKIDLVSTDEVGNRVNIVKNLSTPGKISLAPSISFSTIQNPSGIEVSDMDGDGKLDIATTLLNNSLVILKNISTPSNISFTPNVSYDSSNLSYDRSLALGDINGDGKNDVVTTSQQNISIFTNNVNASPSIESFTPTNAAAGTTIVITGTNFTDATAVNFGGTPAKSFTVNSATKITAVVGNGSSGNVTITNSFGPGSAPGFAFGLPPIINSISPPYSQVGSSIKINGKNFNPNPNYNTVYFGGAKASVTSASDSLLSVTVPRSVMHNSITATTNGLTAYSLQLFSAIFPGASNSFSQTSFKAPIIMQNTNTETVFDVDGDGKLDILYNMGIAGISAARNISTIDSVSFEPNITFATGADVGGSTFGDLDGDGKPDVVTTNGDSANISLLRNESTPGSISLRKIANYPTGFQSGADGVVVSDIDGDGRPDIIVTNYSARTVSIFPNQSSKDSIMLGERIDYGLPAYPTGLIVRDINNDGKPDIVLSMEGDSIPLFINTSIPGTISMANPVNIFLGSALDVAASDLDGDGKIDLVFADGSSTIRIFRNLSTAKNISFAPEVDATTGNGPFKISIGDLDGDGKPDIISPDHLSGLYLTILKNVSVPGKIVISPKVDYLVGTVYPATYPYSSYMGDINGDGLPDIVVSLFDGEQAILINAIPSSLPITLLNLTAIPQKNTVLTQWQTATEENSSYFNVQRSTDAVHFTTVGKVAAAGNSIAQQDYAYTDDVATLLNSYTTFYYRLQEFDKNGDETISKIVKVVFPSQNITISASPNPVKDVLTVRINNYSGNATLGIFDMVGRKLQQVTQYTNSANAININTSPLAAGTYIISTVVNGVKLEQKFVKL